MGIADHAESHYWITPFFMVYGAEAVLPCDIIHDSPRVRMYEEKEVELDRQDSLDALGLPDYILWPDCWTMKIQY